MPDQVIVDPRAGAAITELVPAAVLHGVESPPRARPRADHLRTAWATWRPAVLCASACFVAYKLITEVVLLTAVYGASFPRVLRQDPRRALLAWNGWDSGWFVDDARFGYVIQSHHLISTGQFQDGTAFPPALPLLTRLTYRLLHIAPLTAGLLVVSVALWLGLVGLHRLVEGDFGRRIAGLSVFFVLIFPSAFFLSSVYAESLLLAAAVWAFLAARSRRWVLAGTLAGVATLAKIDAIVIVVPLLIECLAAAGWTLRERRWRRVGPGLAAVVLLPLGFLAAWMAYLQVRFHDPLRFLTAQKAWGWHFAPIWDPLITAWRDVAGLGIFDLDHGLVYLLDIATVFALGGLAVYTYVRVRRSYGVFLGLVFLSLGFSGQLNSYNRHVAAAFPLFVALAVLAARRPWLERALTVSLLPIGVYLLGRFAVGAWAG